MKKVLSLIFLWCVLGLPGWAFCQPEATESPNPLGGNIHLFCGAKYLEADNMEPVDNHLEGGLLMDLKKESWWVSIALDLLFSRDSEDIPIAVVGLGVINGDVTSQTMEVNLGIRKIFDHWEHARPYIGGGLALIQTRFEADELNAGVADTDTRFGVWADAGIYFTVYERFNIGVDARYSRAKADIFGLESKAGGWHVGALAGYHW